MSTPTPPSDEALIGHALRFVRSNLDDPDVLASLAEVGPEPLTLPAGELAIIRRAWVAAQKCQHVVSAVATVACDAGVVEVEFACIKCGVLGRAPKLTATGIVWSDAKGNPE